MDLNSPFVIEVNLNDFNKIDTLTELLFIRIDDENNTEDIIDNKLDRLTRYVFDEHQRCIENIIYERTAHYKNELGLKAELSYMYHSTVYHSYLNDQPYPFRSKCGGFWVANKYDNQNRLVQAVSSKGSTVQMTYRHGGLVEKRFKIQTDIIREYVYTYEPDNNNNNFIEYEDSEGNYWNYDLDYECPFESPANMILKLNNNNDFLL